MNNFPPSSKSDMISLISIATTSIRLVFIDFAGLSSKPDDIRLFVGYVFIMY